MEIIINKCFGGFGVNDKILKKYKLQNLSIKELRTNQKLINLIKQGINVNTYYSNLKVVTIPKNVTDFYITNDDGMENIMFIINRKIYAIKL